MKRKRPPEHWWKSDLRRKYNITPDDYYIILESQSGVCAICEKPCSTGRRLAVDHDHITGENRGLLCFKCNRGIGIFDDNINLLQKAIDYLERELIKV